MKNQYVGDIGDYSKLGMLIALSQAGFSIGINWYLTPNEPKHSKTVTDGKYIQYLDLPCDTNNPKLFSALCQIVKNEKRAVKNIENKNLFPNSVTYWNKILESKSRDVWHSKALKKLSNNSIIFCDPDNGLEVKSTKPYSKNGNKYTTYKEIVDYYKNGSSVIVYNHRDRKPEEDYIKRFTKFREIEETAQAKLFYLRASRYSVRDYLFIIHERHFSDLERAINSFLATEWCRYLTKYSL